MRNDLFKNLWSLCFSDRLNELRNDFKFSNIFFLFLMSIMVNIAILNASSKYDDICYVNYPRVLSQLFTLVISIYIKFRLNIALFR